MATDVSQLSKRILIADADPIMRHFLTALVGKEGYDAVAVSDGRAAYRILQSDSNFRAGIFDMNMPHLECGDLTRHMRTEKRLRRIPVLMISAERDLQLVAKSLTAGSTAFLTKPFNPQQFLTTLRILLTSKTAHTPENN